MQDIIGHTDSVFNLPKNHSSNLSQSPKYVPDRIPSLPFSLLKILYEDHQVQGFGQRGVEELTRRFNCERETISRAYTHLASLGFTKSEHNGNQIRKRWITWEGFQWLETKMSHQMSHQIVDIPYIDLPETKALDNNIINTPPTCGQLEPDAPLQDKIDIFLESRRVGYQDKHDIKDAIKRSTIGYNRKSLLLDRLFKATRDKPIRSIKSYCLASLHTEEKTVEFWKNIGASVNLPFNAYSEGCNA